MLAIIFFLTGLFIGSFLNVVIFRIEKQESFVRGRSRCQGCGSNIYWFDNVPVLSFLLLQGRCRSCDKPISWQYPLVELVTGLLFTSALLVLQFYTEYARWEQALLAFFLLLSFCFAVLISIYDFRSSLIPNTFLWGLNGSALGFLLSHWVFGLSPSPFFPPDILSSLMGAAVSGGFFFLLVYLSKETWMGWGDVWLGWWAGLLLGLELVQLFITLAFSLGAVVGLSLLYFRKKTLKTEIAFGPYLLAAGFVLLFALYLSPEALQFLSPWLPGTIEGDVRFLL